jgi:hypothetical protein
MVKIDAALVRVSVEQDHQDRCNAIAEQEAKRALPGVTAIASIAL